MAYQRHVSAAPAGPYYCNYSTQGGTGVGVSEEGVGVSVEGVRVGVSGEGFSEVRGSSVEMKEMV